MIHSIIQTGADNAASMNVHAEIVPLNVLNLSYAHFYSTRLFAVFPVVVFCFSCVTSF